MAACKPFRRTPHLPGLTPCVPSCVPSWDVALCPGAADTRLMSVDMMMLPVMRVELRRFNLTALVSITPGPNRVCNAAARGRRPGPAGMENRRRSGGSGDSILPAPGIHDGIPGLQNGGNAWVRYATGRLRVRIGVARGGLLCIMACERLPRATARRPARGPCPGRLLLYLPPT